ncbi:uncharacterized protein METZ01_LOCUS469431, partial [marine metagenome]
RGCHARDSAGDRRDWCRLYFERLDDAFGSGYRLRARLVTPYL